jgi:hypothetical protein
MIVSRAVASASVGSSGAPEDEQEDDTQLDSMAWIEGLPRGAFLSKHARAPPRRERTPPSRCVR